MVGGLSPGEVFMVKNVLLVFVLVLSLLVCSSLAFAISTVEMGSTPGSHYNSAVTQRTKTVNLNDLKSKGIDKELSGAFGYERGYMDALAKKPMQPYYILTSRKVVGLSPNDGASHFQVEKLLAKTNKGNYISAYRQAYRDAKNGREAKISGDLFVRYDLLDASQTKRILSVQGPSSTVALSSTQHTTQYSFYNKYSVTPDMSTVDIAHAIGKKDAEDEKGKAPLQALETLRFLTTIESDALYRKLNTDRGDFITYYNLGYESIKPVKETVPYFSSLRSQSQKPASQKKMDATRIGEKYGRLHALLGERKRPYQFYSRWYFDRMSPEESAIARADSTTYVRTYKAAYDQLNTQIVQQQLTWKERMEDIGYDHGSADKIEGVPARPHALAEHYRRKGRSGTDLEIAAQLKIHFGSFLNGYRKGYAAE